MFNFYGYCTVTGAERHKGESLTSHLIIALEISTFLEELADKKLCYSSVLQCD